MRAGVLVRNETLKTTRRFAFWVTLLSFGGIASIINGESWASARGQVDKTFALPDAWGTILSDIGPLPAIFGAVALILLVTGEFSWKTARQNVIDGLSKNEFFAGKVLLYPAVGATFLALLLALIAVFAGAGTDPGATTPLVRGTDLALMGGVATTVLGYTSIAFFAAFLARSSGGAMGLFFLYVAFLEQIAGAVLSRIGGAFATAAAYLPRAVFDRLFDPRQFDPAARQASIDHALEAGKDAPVFHDTGLLLALAFSWIAAFLLGSWLVYRRRDL
jgi:ABC-2 type transport system permease protein